MASKQLRLLGLHATIFANRSRAGVEFSVPVGGLRRASHDHGQLVPTSPLPAIVDEPLDEAGRALARRVGELSWYHTIDLGHGVATPGFYDHRPILDHYQLPLRLDGLRVLDVACFDGFWSFEFERRGAAEVVALDIATARELDLPYGRRDRMSEAELERRFGAGFAVAHEVLGSRVKHVHCNLYDLTPELLGQFDLVHLGDVLLHLRDPARALHNLRRVTRGRALISDCIYPDLDRHGDLPLMQYDGGRGDNIWWRFGAQALQRMIGDAGFERVTEAARFRYGPRGQPASMWHAVFDARP